MTGQSMTVLMLKYVLVRAALRESMACFTRIGLSDQIPVNKTYLTHNFVRPDA